MDDWKQIQDDLRAGVYGPWAELMAYVDEYAYDLRLEEVGSSDINHILYNAVKSGSIRKQVTQ